MIVMDILLFLAGSLIVIATVTSAIKTFVLPRGTQNRLARVVFRTMRLCFYPWANPSRPYLQRDRVLAFFAPVSLLALEIVWLFLVAFGYMLMYWSLETHDWKSAFTLSGSSLLTLGFATTTDIVSIALAFSEAIIGLILVALLISYLPTMYSSFSRRELTVSMLAVRAGTPPSPVEMLLRFYRIQGLERLGEIFAEWEIWFGEVEESHSSLAALAFFRSPVPERSWITAASAVLDTAAFKVSTLNLPRDFQAQLCIRAGFLCLRSLAVVLNIPYDPDPQADGPIRLTRAQFDRACDELETNGLPLKADRDQSWRDFSGWRVNYEQLLSAFAYLTVAPVAPWLPEPLPLGGLARPVRHKFKKGK